MFLLFPVSWLVSVMLASGTTAPFGSVITPWIPALNCACAGTVKSGSRSVSATTITAYLAFVCMDIQPPIEADKSFYLHGSISQVLGFVKHHFHAEIPD